MRGVFSRHIGGGIAVVMALVFALLALVERSVLALPGPFMRTDIALAVGAFSALVALLMSAFGGWLIVKSQHLHGHLSHDHCDAGPQKMHSEPTPRIGGLAVATGLALAGGVLLVLKAKYGADFTLNTMNFFLVLFSALPAFLGGISEDLTKRVGPFDRLMLTMASGALAAWLLGATLTRLDIPVLDGWLISFPLLAIVLTAFAVAGIANAINIIDGFNGLASGYAIVILLALAVAGWLAQDGLVVELSLVLAGALTGFLFWNWPCGRLFLGDGGAYLVGFLLAEISVLLVMRNPEVSAWLPLVLLIYPVSETLYSIYRRKRLHKTNAGEPDRAHLHHLIHARIVHLHLNTPHLREDKRTNPKVGKYIGVANLVIATTALLAWNATPWLMVLAVVYALAYGVAYRVLAR